MTNEQPTLFAMPAPEPPSTEALLRRVEACEREIAELGTASDRTAAARRASLQAQRKTAADALMARGVTLKDKE